MNISANALIRAINGETNSLTTAFVWEKHKFGWAFWNEQCERKALSNIAKLELISMLTDHLIGVVESISKKDLE